MELRRVVVTGLGAITPIGKTVPEYWEGLKNGTSGSDWISRFDAGKFKTRFACEVKDFSPEDHFDRKELRKLDLFSVFALIAAEEAIQDSQMDLEAVDRDMGGIVFASGIGGITTYQNEVINYAKGDGTPRFSPFFIVRMISDIAAGHMSMKYGLRGPNLATVSACASSTNAIIDAVNYIRLGYADFMIGGGAEAPINEAAVGGFNSIQAMSTDNDNYKSASRPFDKNRDGFVMGEGAGALILEDYEHARRRGAKIYAEVQGLGMSADAYHLTAPHPEGEGAKLVMKRALENAKLRPEEVDYINVHGTATPRGDIAEILAIKDVFGEHAYKLNLSSSKSMTGHLLGAAGAVEAIAAILSINNNLVPPTINLKEPDPEIDPRINLTPVGAQERKVNVAISNTFGFGGHNTSIVFKKAPDQ